MAGSEGEQSLRLRGGESKGKAKGPHRIGPTATAGMGGGREEVRLRQPVTQRKVIFFFCSHPGFRLGPGNWGGGGG